MPRKKPTPVAKPDAILPDELLEKLIPGPMDAAGVEAVFQKLKKAVIERALGAELGVHLASPEGGRGNHRNGRSGKTGARQGSCRPGHAAEGLFSVPGQDAALTMTSRSGFKATASIGSQLRVWRDQRPGLRSRAWR